MRSAQVDLTENPIYIGCDWSQLLQFVQPNGQPLDLAGVQARSQLRRPTGELAADLVIGLNLVDRMITLSLSRTATALLTEARHNFDLLLESGGLRLRYIKGVIPVQEPYTQWS